MKEITEEERSKYRKGCLTGLLVALAVVVLSSGINQATGYRTNIKKSVPFMIAYNEEYPKEWTLYDMVIHIANNNFVTVKTNLSDTGEGVSKAEKIKDHILDLHKNRDIKITGIRVEGKRNKILYDSTTKDGR